MSRAKWGFKFLVQHGQQVETFQDKHCAFMYASATHGALWPVEAVNDYGRNFVAIKDGHSPIEVD